jgi:WD40 repeat protein
VRSVAISKDNKYVVSGSQDKTIIVWDRENGSQIKELWGHNDSVQSVAIS